MVSNSDFNFKNTPSLTLELPFSEHIEELRQRIIHIFWVILVLSLLAFVEVKFLVHILELPVSNVKFFQLSPGDYFASTIKISFYTGILFSSPFLISQLILFLLPVCILCSLINTRFRDFYMIMSNVMQLLFFLSPILFNKQLLESYDWLLYINPLALFILLINEPILINQFHLNYLTYLLGYFAFFTCLLAFLFAKYKNKITYWL